jgi:hypothetical protein
MTKTEQWSMRVESERIQDAKRQEICEMVSNDHEAIDGLIQEDLD